LSYQAATVGRVSELNEEDPDPNELHATYPWRASDVL
jgi:hypothetical protein